MSTRLRAEFLFDDEANNWHYRVPALHINGGGAATRKDAEASVYGRDLVRPGGRPQRVRPRYAGDSP